MAHNDAVSVKIIATIACVALLSGLAGWIETRYFPAIREFEPVYAGRMNQDEFVNGNITAAAGDKFRVFRHYEKLRNLSGTFQLCWSCDNGFTVCLAPRIETMEVGRHERNFINSLPSKDFRTYEGAKSCRQYGIYLHEGIFGQLRYEAQSLTINIAR